MVGHQEGVCFRSSKKGSREGIGQGMCMADTSEGVYSSISHQIILYISRERKGRVLCMLYQRVIKRSSEGC